MSHFNKQAILDQINANENLQVTDKNTLLVFFARFIDVLNNRDLNITSALNIAEKKQEDLKINATSSERKLLAGASLSEKKLKVKVEAINNKYDNLLFQSYVDSLNKKDESNSILNAANETYEKQINHLDSLYNDYLAESLIKVNEIKDVYNKHSQLLTSRYQSKIRRLKIFYDELITTKKKEFKQIEDNLSALIDSIYINELGFTRTFSLDEELIKANYTNVSLQVNRYVKKIKQEYQLLINDKEHKYIESLIPYEKNKENLDLHITETRNDISFKYSEILDKINAEFDIKKEKYEKNKKDIEKKYNANITSQGLESTQSDFDLEIANNDINHQKDREQWLYNIEKTNLLRRLEIEKMEIMYKTNLAKLEIAKQDRFYNLETDKKEINALNNMKLMPFEINRELAFKTRNLDLNVLEAIYEITANNNALAALSYKEQLSKAISEHKYLLELYKIKYDHLLTKLRLNMQLSIEKYRIEKDHQINVIRMENLIKKKELDIKGFDAQKTFNKIKIGNAYAVNMLEQQRLFSDFSIEQNRSIELRDNENKMNVLFLNKQRGLDNVRISYIKNLIYLLTEEKANYYTSYLNILKTVSASYQSFLKIITPMFAKYDFLTVKNIIDPFIAITNNIQKTLPNYFTTLKDDIINYSKKDVLNNQLLSASYDAFFQMRIDIVNSYQQMVKSNVKNLEIQVSNLFKELEKTKIKLNDIIYGEDGIRETKKWNDFLTSLTTDISETNMLSKISQDLDSDSNFISKFTNDQDTDYTITSIELHQHVFKELTLITQKIDDFIGRLNKLAKIKDFVSFKIDTKEINEYITSYNSFFTDTEITINKIKGEEFSFLSSTLNKYQQILNTHYEVVKGDLQVFKSRLSELDDKFIEYREYIKEYSIKKLEKSRVEQLELDDIYNSKQSELFLRQEEKLAKTYKKVLEVGDINAKLNDANLAGSLKNNKHSKRDSLRRLSDKLKENLQKSRLDRKKETDKILSKRKSNELRLDSLYHQKEIIRDEYIVIFSKRREELINELNEIKELKVKEKNIFRKKLLSEDKLYKKELRLANKNYRDELKRINKPIHQ